MLDENLPRKLGIKPGMKIALQDPPGKFLEAFRSLSLDQVRFGLLDELAEPDLILWWPRRLADIPQRLAHLAHHIPPAGAVWIVMPKKAHSVERGIDFSWEEMQTAGLQTDLVDNKTASFSGSDYGTRFVIRKDHRDRYT